MNEFDKYSSMAVEKNQRKSTFGENANDPNLRIRQKLNQNDPEYI